MKITRSFSAVYLRDSLIFLLPSSITLTRLFINYILCIQLIAGKWGFPLFSLACVMDFFDGWVARRFHSETSFGAIFDAFADFILVITMSCFLIQMNRIASWFIGLIIVAFIRFILVKPKPESDPLGKHIGTILFIALGLILAIPIPFLAVWSTTIASSYLVISMILSTVMMKRKIKKLI